MRALEVWVNGKQRCRAGLTSPGHLTAALELIKVDTENLPPSTDPRGWAEVQDATFSVWANISLGSAVAERLEWISDGILLGDEVLIKLVEVSKADSPVARERQDSEVIREERRKVYEQLRKEFE